MSSGPGPDSSGESEAGESEPPSHRDGANVCHGATCELEAAGTRGVSHRQPHASGPVPTSWPCSLSPLSLEHRTVHKPAPCWIGMWLELHLPRGWSGCSRVVASGHLCDNAVPQQSCEEPRPVLRDVPVGLATYLGHDTAGFRVINFKVQVSHRHRHRHRDLTDLIPSPSRHL